MHTENLAEYCAPGAAWTEEYLELSSQISLRIVTFSPVRTSPFPPVVFIAGWISLMKGWREVLRELTRDFTVHYVETREKISSRVTGKAGYGVHEIAGDIVDVVDRLGVRPGRYVLLGSSLGATAILECFRSLTKHPLCLVLIGPNAVFRVPLSWKILVTVFYPPLYALIRPAVKWYLRTFRLNVQADRAQYDKYCEALDAAEPRKLKKAVRAVWSYEVWSALDSVDCPVLLVNASKDKLHEPENLKRMALTLPHATEVDLETNAGTHSGRVVAALRSFLPSLGKT